MSVDVPARPDSLPETLLAQRIARLSTQAPFAVPVDEPGRRVVHLTSGGPAPEALPTEDLAETFARVLRGPRRGEALAYSDSPGVPGLRAVLAEREGVDRSRVLVTNGALHGLHLTFSAVVEPGDVVLVDDPVFPDTPRAIADAGGTVRGVPVDGDGLDVDAVEDLLRAGTRVKVVYTVPDFQNPSGAVLSARRRTRLVELAERYGFLVLSDNPYRRHGLAEGVVDDFPDDSDHVVRVSTFSKTLGPGLRLGWLVAPSWLVPHLVNVRRRIDFQSATLTQAVAADLLERPGWFEALETSARAVYRRRAHALVTSLRAHATDVLAFDEPTGGFFVWARVVAPGVTPAALARAAVARGFVFPTGTPFAVHVDSPAHHHVRLAFSGADLDDLHATGPAIAAAARSVLGGE